MRTVKGLDTVPAADRPPVNVVRFAFQTMVAIGTALAALGAGFLVLGYRRRRLPRSLWFYRAVVLAGPASLVALIAGWITTEVGPPALGRLPRDAHVAGRHGREWDPGRLRHARAVYQASRSPWRGCCGGSPRRSHGAVRVRLAEVPAVLMLTGWLPTRCSPERISARASGSSSVAAPSGTRRSATHAHHAMGPVWEANHVWLIFVLVVCWTAYPTRLRLDRLHALLPALHRGHRHHPARHDLCAELGRDECAPAAADRAQLRRLLDPDAVRPRCADRRHRVRPCTGRQRRRRPRRQLAQPDLDRPRVHRRGDVGVPGRGLPRRRRGAHRQTRLEARSAGARWRWPRRRRCGARRPRRRAQRRPPDLGRPDRWRGARLP